MRGVTFATTSVPALPGFAKVTSITIAKSGLIATASVIEPIPPTSSCEVATAITSQRCLRLKASSATVTAATEGVIEGVSADALTAKFHWLRRRRNHISNADEFLTRLATIRCQPANIFAARVRISSFGSRVAGGMTTIPGRSRGTSALVACTVTICPGRQMRGSTPPTCMKRKALIDAGHHQTNRIHAPRSSRWVGVLCLLHDESPPGCQDC